MRIVFLGTGLIAWAHSLVLKAMKDANVIDATIATCFDTDRTRAERFAAAHGCTIASSADEAVNKADAVWVCTSTAHHLELVRLSAKARVPVFCEKPLGRSLAEAREIVNVVVSAGVPSQVGLVLRTCPVYLMLKSLVGSGEFGRLMAVQMRDDQFLPVTGHYASTWRGDVEQAGGGTVIEHSIHDLDILAFCAGEPATIAARTENFAGHTGIEDSAVVTLAFAGGSLGSLVSVWHQIPTRPSTRRIEAIFERAIVSFDSDFAGPVHVLSGSGQDVRQAAAPGWVLDLPLPKGDIGLAIRMYAQENRDFIDALSRGNAPVPSLADGLVAHRLVEAVYRSAAMGGEPVSPESL